MAQWSARRTRNLSVLGSSPALGSFENEALENGLLLRVEEHRTRHQNGMGKRETLSLIYDKCMQPGSRNRDKLMHWHERTTMSCRGRVEYF